MLPIANLLPEGLNLGIKGCFVTLPNTSDWSLQMAVQLPSTTEYLAGPQLKDVHCQLFIVANFTGTRPLSPPGVDLYHCRKWPGRWPTWRSHPNHGAPEPACLAVDVSKMSHGQTMAGIDDP